MPKVTFVYEDRTERVIDAVAGDSVMAAAVRNGVPGIVAECGGHLSCATCHVWVREEFTDMTGQPGDLEDDLLDLGVSERRDTSRLSCQITLDAGHEGLILDVPPTQP